MVEPTVPDFDFDQHIANLIARSEQMLGVNKPRGWDDEEEDEEFELPESVTDQKTNIDEDNLDKLLKDYGLEEDEEEEVVVSLFTDFFSVRLLLPSLILSRAK